MKSISVYNERNTDMLKISVNADPNEAAILANKVIDVYKRDLEWVVGEMTHKVFFK